MEESSGLSDLVRMNPAPGLARRANPPIIPLRVQRSDMPLVRRAPACAPRERADTRRLSQNSEFRKNRAAFLVSRLRRECMTWRLSLYYRPEFQTITGQSPEDIGIRTVSLGGSKVSRTK